MQHVADQQSANHRGQVQINTDLYQLRRDLYASLGMSPEQFDALVAWPGDRPIFPEGAEAALAHPDEEDGDGDDPDDGDGDVDMAKPADDII